MTIYGTKIKSDIDFPQDLSHSTETRYEVELSSKLPILDISCESTVGQGKTG